jgi:hypothetical protein
MANYHWVPQQYIDTATCITKLLCGSMTSITSTIAASATTWVLLLLLLRRL